MIVFFIAVVVGYGSVGVIAAVAWLLAALRDRTVDTLDDTLRRRIDAEDQAIALTQPDDCCGHRPTPEDLRALRAANDLGRTAAQRAREVADLEDLLRYSTQEG